MQFRELRIPPLGILWGISWSVLGTGPRIVIRTVPWRLARVAAGALLLTACQTVAVVPATPPQNPPAADLIVEPSAEDLALVDDLLEDAEAAFSADQLMYPAATSALTLFERVLVLDPDNQDAERGVERIVERYLQLALKAAGRQRYEEAEGFMALARLVDEDHPSIKPTALQIELLRQAKRQRLTLDRSLLRERDATLAAELAEFGGHAKDPACHVVISVGNDAEGRWVYQQLAAAPGVLRIRAQIQISWPTNVELRCLNNSG